MKKPVFFLVFSVIFLIGIVSAALQISFISPTPSESYKTNFDSFVINSSIISSSGLQELIFNWDSTNYTFYNSSVVLMMNFENNSLLGENNSFVRDISLYENNGTVSGTMSNTTGEYGNAYSFSGREKITVANSASLNITDNLTISLWAKSNNVNIKSVSAGGLHTCILTEKGDVYCLGDNTYGELGTGDTINSPLPKLVSGGYNFTSISAGFCHTCAINATGSAYCWGYNGQGSCAYGEVGPGELGNGNTTNMNTPQLVLGGYNFSFISSGYYFTCAINTTGSAFCWGYNNLGQLGIGNTSDMYYPQLVLGGNTFSSISCGTNHHQHTCAINTTGSAFCWGENINGHLGNGNVTNMPTPQRVLGGMNFTSISSASSHTCAINTTGSAFCWGRGDYGSLGTGNSSTLYTPQLVIGGYNFTSVTSGEHTTCAVAINGSVFCWGYNVYGQVGLGTGNTTLAIFSPQLVLGGYNFTSISSFCYHNCGKTVDNDIYCWGINVYGQLGTGFIETLYPKPILGGYNFTSISSGKHRVCGLDTIGSEYCWGNNDYGGLGIGNTTHMFTPQRVLGGYNFTSISEGYSNNCALTATGSAYCWGDNYYGEVGNGNITDMNTPQLVLGGYNFTSISAGTAHVCALNATGSAYCWGYNAYGQLGLGTGNTTNMYTPQLVLGGYNFSSIVVGSYHTCALNTTGGAFCWGYNAYGQLGIGNTTNMPNPQRVLGGNNFKLISSNFYNTCGVNSTGGAFCWGYNAYGELGLANTTNMPTPQKVLGGHNFSLISTGYLHTCAINSTGSAYCWGYNLFGQLGNGNTTAYGAVGTFYFPQLVLGGYNFSSITQGYGHTCAKTAIGETYCWGYNIFGQLGNGRTTMLSPAFKAIKSVLVGKSINSFLIGESFGGTILSVLNQNPTEIGTLDDWENILLSYNQTGDLYLNETLVHNSPYIKIESDPSAIAIGENFDGSIDEVKVLDRTFSYSEVQQLQKSNLKKINETSWEFYSLQSLPSEKTYSYSLYAKDLVSWYSLLRSIIKSLSNDEEDTTLDYSGGYPIFRPNEGELNNGYKVIVFKDWKVSFKVGSISHTFKVEDVTQTSAKISISSETQEAILSVGQEKKFELSGDNYYDLLVKLNSIVSLPSSIPKANITIQTINEEIPAENKEPVKENTGKEAVNNEPPAKSKSNIIYYILGGIIVLGIITFLLRKVKRKKRYMKYGY